MFKHPIRDLVVLSLVGWYAKRKIAKNGGMRKLVTAASRPFSRSRSTARSR
jgi:hypothetical protein